MSLFEGQIARRARIDRMSEAELKIREALVAVEAVGAHPWLTDAVTLLGRAQSKVADFLDKDDPSQHQFVGYPKYGDRFDTDFTPPREPAVTFGVQEDTALVGGWWVVELHDGEVHEHVSGPFDTKADAEAALPEAPGGV